MKSKEVYAQTSNSRFIDFSTNVVVNLATRTGITYFVVTIFELSVTQARLRSELKNIKKHVKLTL